jgi:hypothetical protein
MSPPSLYPKDSKFQASEILKPFDFTTHPDWPINPPLKFNLKTATAERPLTPTRNPTISPRRVKFPPPSHQVENKSYPNPQIISGNILHQTTKSVKIFTSSVSQNPSLAFVDIKLSSPTNIGDESKCIKIKALHDSGCAKTVIKHSVFEQFVPSKCYTSSKCFLHEHIPTASVLLSLSSHIWDNCQFLSSYTFSFSHG